jgi:nicotinamidase-related amidase
LKSQNITELVFVGMMTQMCIDATVRAAKDLNFECSVIAYTTATRDLEVNGFLLCRSEEHGRFFNLGRTIKKK